MNERAKQTKPNLSGAGGLRRQIVWVIVSEHYRTNEERHNATQLEGLGEGIRTVPEFEWNI